MNNKSKFLKNLIVFEGLDGAGTTTQKKILVDFLKNKGYSVISDAEPTDSPIGRFIRETYLSKKEKTTPLALALLYSADRDNHINNKETGLKKVLGENNVVVCDRFFYSSLAYQGVDLPYELVESINDYESPEYLIYIDTSVDECLRRIENRGEKKELFEVKSFLESTKNNFDKTFAKLPKGIKFLRIDGTKTLDDISEEIKKFISQYF